MKLIDLLNKINNGEIKEGTEFKFVPKPNWIFKYENDRIMLDGSEALFTIDKEKLSNEEIEVINDKPVGRWKPENKDNFFYISASGVIFSQVWQSDKYDEYMYATKNVFKHLEEAEDYLAYKKALLEAEKPFEYGEYNYCISVDIERKTLYLDFLYSTMEQGTIYLGTDEDVAQAFVDKWHKQILKYEFGIEE